MKNNSSFQQVFDKAHRRIRGLWQRNGTFYVQTTISDSVTGVKKVTKIPLKTAKTPADASKEMAGLLGRLDRGEVVVGGTGPTIAEYRKHYTNVNVKSPKSVYDENGHLGKWEEFLGGETRIGSITPKNILAYRTQKLDDGLTARTVNLRCRALKQLLKLARQEGHITKLPTDGIIQIKERKVEKPLMETKDLISLGTEALRNHDRNGKQFADVILLLMFSGARISETLSLKWENVDWNQDQLVFSGDVTKNGETRRVDFNPNLKNHLLCMKETATSEFLFPSPRTDKPVTTLKKMLNMVKLDTEQDKFTFHLTRHYFISECVMAGVDFLTIAKWVGHKDGGVLIGKTYGHLSRKHMKEQAEKLKF